MRSLFWVFAAAALGPLTFSAAPSESAPLSAQPARGAETRAPTVSWVHDGLDTKGRPIELDHFEFALSPADADLREGGRRLALKDIPARSSGGEQSVRDLFPGQPGGKYRLWIRAVSQKGQASDWGGPVEVALDGAGSGKSHNADRSKADAPRTSATGTASRSSGAGDEAGREAGKAAPKTRREKTNGKPGRRHLPAPGCSTIWR